MDDPDLSTVSCRFLQTADPQDLVSDAYIQDVVVLRQFRGCGIGGQIIQTLINGLKKNGVDWIGLIGEPGTGRFYESLGFRPMAGHTPYRLKD
jgi:spermidine synthase